MKTKPKFKEGDKVRHDTFHHFGLGTVKKGEVYAVGKTSNFTHYFVEWEGRDGGIWCAESELIPVKGD